MKIFACLSWIQPVCRQVYELLVPNTTDGDLPNTTIDRDLPCELIVDILSRLPANCVVLCGHASKPLLTLTRTPSFLSMHLERARARAPVIAFQYYAVSDDLWIFRPAKDVRVSFTDETLRKVASSEHISIDFSRSRGLNPSLPFLYGSCDGFLMFRNLGYESVLFLWNPATQEQVSVIAPHRGYRACGLFFHPMTKEYRAVYVKMTKDKRQFEFFILSLKTKSLRLVTTSRHPPSKMRQPVIVNGALYWLLDDYPYFLVNEYSCPRCNRDSIVIFNMESEKVSAMGHPGYPCNLSDSTVRHFKMKLMEKDGKLWFVNDFEYGEIVMWMLEDYNKRFWVKMHVIKVEDPCPFNALHMFGDELLVMVSCLDLYSYNLKVRSWRRFPMPGPHDNSRDRKWLSVVVHAATLVSLETDRVIFPFKDGIFEFLHY